MPVTIAFSGAPDAPVSELSVRGSFKPNMVPIGSAGVKSVGRKHSAPWIASSFVV